MRHLVALVELGEPDYIIYKIDEPLRLRAYVTDKARHILVPDHSVFNKLRAPDYALKRSFQLVRDIRCELAPHLFGVLLFRHVEEQNNRPARRAVRFYAADVELIYSAAVFCARLAVSALFGALYRGGYLAAAVNRNKILADAFFVRFKQSARGGVYAQYLSVVVEEHKPLFHVVRYLRELVRLFLQSLYLFFYLLVLAVNPAEQGSDLVICFVFERVLEVERVERLNYLF